MPTVEAGEKIKYENPSIYEHVERHDHRPSLYVICDHRFLYYMCVCVCMCVCIVV